MSSLPHPSPALLLCAVILLALQGRPANAQATMRTWTDAQGRTMQATLMAVEGENAVFQMAAGQTLKFPLAKLSAADQELAKKSGGGAAATTPKPSGGGAAATPRIPVEKRIWPDVVEVPTRSIEIAAVEEKPAEKRCVYRSEAFEFVAEDKLAGSVMKEIARTFEATRALLIALPWGVDPKPGAETGRFLAKFYETRTSYLNAGWSANSGGVYSSRDRTFHIPFQSLGLEMRGKTWFKDENYRNDTIIHEITHQLMHDYLALLPTWVIEGTAEYVEMLPYKAGRFQAGSHQRGIKEYLSEGATRSRAPSDIGSIHAHVTMKEEDWRSRTSATTGSSTEMGRLYFCSCLMVYYFCHLDGDGKGTRFMRYLDSMAEVRSAWTTFFANPLVKHDKETGRYSWNPSQITPPPQKLDDEYGLSQLTILLDGRTPEQLEADVKEGYKKIGVKW